MNHFASTGAAERYARGRPFFHPLVVDRLQQFVSSDLSRAIDVGCGTGQSSVALTAIAQSVIGIDVASAMLSVAELHPRVRYLESPAEALPFGMGEFDLCTAGLAFHWFDRDRFLIEAWRVLRPDGWLAIYSDGFSGQMKANCAYSQWNSEHYLERYPTPPRRAAAFTDAVAAKFGFRRVGHDEFTHNVTFAPSALVAYLMTQTNVSAALDESEETINVATEWLLAGVSPLFSEPSADFPFRCILDVFQRVDRMPRPPR